MKIKHDALKEGIYVSAALLLAANIGLNIYAIITELKANYELYTQLAYILLVLGTVLMMIAAYFYTRKIWKSLAIGLGIYVGLLFLLNLYTYIHDTFMPTHFG